MVSRTPGVPASGVRYQKKKTKLHGFPQLFNHSVLLMSRKYICVASEYYVLDQREAFSHSCLVWFLIYRNSIV